MSELLPCPLCASTDLFLRDIAGWELDCRGCELSLVLTDDPSREGLIKRWNTRTPSDAAVRACADEIETLFVPFYNQDASTPTISTLAAIITKHLAARTGEEN